MKFTFGANSLIVVLCWSCGAEIIANMAATIIAATTIPPRIMKIFLLPLVNFPKGQGDLAEGGGIGGGGSEAIIKIQFL
jgi:hypothetical protein